MLHYLESFILLFADDVVLISESPWVIKTVK